MLAQPKKGDRHDTLLTGLILLGHSLSSFEALTQQLTAAAECIPEESRDVYAQMAVRLKEMQADLVQRLGPTRNAMLEEMSAISQANRERREAEALAAEEAAPPQS